MNDCRFVVSRLSLADLDEVVSLFETVSADRTAEGFHPQGFTADEAARICEYGGRDLYLGARWGGALIGYGLLRGWDEGYTVPSLGIFIISSARGRGLGRKFMLQLHDQARHEGATRVMLKVYPDNRAAVSLYKSIGYVFSARSAGQLVGHVEI
jgi:ribosomal-protein-alanine N-acetyltransferase